MNNDELKDNLAVDLLAVQIKRKLAKAREDGKGGWDTDSCPNEYLSGLLQCNVESGDPVDVAAYCAFLVARGETIKVKTQEQARLDKLEKSYTELGRQLDAFVKSANKLVLKLESMENLDGSAIKILADN